MVLNALRLGRSGFGKDHLKQADKLAMGDSFVADAPMVLLGSKDLTAEINKLQRGGEERLKVVRKR